VEIFWPSKAWVDDAAQPAITMAVALEALLPTAAPDLLDRKVFIDAYLYAMDPQGVHGKQYDTDFGRIYDLMHLPQRPTNAELSEFVRILYKHKIEDPESDPTEKNDVISAIKM